MKLKQVFGLDACLKWTISIIDSIETSIKQYMIIVPHFVEPYAPKDHTVFLYKNVYSTHIAIVNMYVE